MAVLGAAPHGRSFFLGSMEVMSQVECHRVGVTQERACTHIRPFISDDKQLDKEGLSCCKQDGDWFVLVLDTSQQQEFPRGVVYEEVLVAATSFNNTLATA